MAQRIRRLTSNQKIGGSNPSVVDILFYTKEISYKGCQYKGQHLATEQTTDTIDRTHGRMAQRIRRLGKFLQRIRIRRLGVRIPMWSTFCFTQRKFLRKDVNIRDG